IGLRRPAVVSKLGLARKRLSLGKDHGPQDTPRVGLTLPPLKLAFHFLGVKELRCKNSDLPHLCLNAVSNCTFQSLSLTRRSLPLTPPSPGETIAQGIVRSLPALRTV